MISSSDSEKPKKSLTNKIWAYILMILGFLVVIVSPFIWIFLDLHGLVIFLTLIIGLFFIGCGLFIHFKEIIRPIMDGRKSHTESKLEGSAQAQEQYTAMEKERYEKISKGLRRDNTLFLGLITLLVIAAIVEYWLHIGGMAFYLTVFMVVPIVAIAILRMLMVPVWVKNWPEYVPDERVKRIDVHARAGAFYIAFFALIILSTLTLLKILDLGSYNSLLVTWLVMGYSWFTLRWYYGRKGDIE